MTTERTTLTDGSPVTADHRKIDPSTGMQKDYVVLSEEERAKGFVRPLRYEYVHVGSPGPSYSLRDLTEEEHKQYDKFHYVKFETYPDGHQSGLIGRYWTQDGINKIGAGCQQTTKMAAPIAETYAREPTFYGGTFCTHCRDHFPVGAHGEFVWLGTDERVGT